jgi:hypothetical protein
MTRAFLGGRDDLRQLCVERPAVPERLLHDDHRAQQRMGESHALAVELENARVECLRETEVEAPPDGGSDE